MNVRKSAGIVLVHPDRKPVRFLLLRAYGNWDFPKGRVEGDESPLEAAIRETTEETDLTSDEIRFEWGTEFVETVPGAGGKVARLFLARALRSKVHLPVSRELGRPEHHEWRWVTAEQACELLRPRLIPVIQWAGSIMKRNGSAGRSREESALSRKARSA